MAPDKHLRSTLTVSSLHCRQGQRSLLQIADFVADEAQFIAITGANGAGKSTLLSAICGDRRYEGDISLHGKNLQQWSLRETARHLAYLPQASSLSFGFSAYEVVALGLTPLTIDRISARQKIKEMMQRCDCAQLSRQLYTSLSGGQKQRVQLARVLLQLSQAEHSPILLLDEPTSAQDLGQQHALLAMIKHLCVANGYTVLAILHDLNQVLRYCHRCLVLDGGKVVADGPPDATLSPELVEKCWHYRATRVMQSDRVHALL